MLPNMRAMWDECFVHVFAGGFLKGCWTALGACRKVLGRKNMQTTCKDAFNNHLYKTLFKTIV